MAKPRQKDIAAALGIDSNQVSQLAKRGMPVHKLSLARDWFNENGFRSINPATGHGRGHGARLWKHS
jgi:hypothetical protein